MSIYSCNCAYGTSDPRCCVAKARRAELVEAHRLGREGKPLPAPDEPIKAYGWFGITPESMRMLGEERAALARTPRRRWWRELRAIVTGSSLPDDSRF